jgi:hypothetical protein
MFRGWHALLWQVGVGIAVGLAVALAYPWLSRFFPAPAPIELHIRIEWPAAPMPPID